jgi:hypothetical protein
VEGMGGIAQFQNVPRSFLNTAEEAAAPVIKKDMVNICKGYSFRKWGIVNDVRDTASVKGSWPMERRRSSDKKNPVGWDAAPVKRLSHKLQ